MAPENVDFIAEILHWNLFFDIRYMTYDIRHMICGLAFELIEVSMIVVTVSSMDKICNLKFKHPPRSIMLPLSLPMLPQAKYSTHSSRLCIVFIDQRLQLSKFGGKDIVGH
jgi:hypothetical protein